MSLTHLRSTILIQVLISFLLEDTWFYFIHRLLHHGWFYKNIHKIHHEHNAPFGIAAEYAHPVENIFLGIGTALGPMIIGMTTGIHIFTVWFWVVIRLWQTVDVHSGYDFPWSPNHYIPFWGGTN
jgi:methylsterol monooxygenase